MYNSLSRKSGPANFISLSENNLFLIYNSFHPTRFGLKFVNLNRFFYQRDFFENANSFWHPIGIQYYNIFKRMNFLSSMILNKVPRIRSFIKDYTGQSNTRGPQESLPKVNEKDSCCTGWCCCIGIKSRTVKQEKTTAQKQRMSMAILARGGRDSVGASEIEDAHQSEMDTSKHGSPQVGLGSEFNDRYLGGVETLPEQIVYMAKDLEDTESHQHDVESYRKLMDFFGSPQAILDQYKVVNLISLRDLVTMIGTLTLFGLDEFISDFIEVILENRNAKIPEFATIVDAIRHAKEDFMPRIMEVLALNQFEHTEGFYGTKDMIDSKAVLSSITAQGLPESEDKVAFQIPEEGRNPIPIDIYKFKIPFNPTIPNVEFVKYLRLCQEHIDNKDPKVWTDPKFKIFICYLWDLWKWQQQAYLLYSMIPLVMNFITGWCIGRMKELGLENQANNDFLEWAHFSALITAFTIAGLNFYEVLQIISTKNQSAYWGDTNSYVDILAQGMVQ
jgi:hypothetical protein